MTPLDIAFIVGYFLIILAAGFWSSRKEGLEGFLIGDRNLGSFSTTMSIISSKIGGGMILAYVTYAFVFGPGAFTYFLGALLGYILFYFFAQKLKHLADVHKFYTIVDYLEHRFGNSRIIALGLLIPSVLAYAIQIVGGGKILELIAGIPFGWAVFTMLSITTTYLIIGGFRSVVFTDVFQGGLFVILFLAATFLFFGEASSLSSPSFDTLSVPLMIGFFVLGAVYPFSSLDLWQRVYAAKSLKVLKRSMLSTLIMYFAVGAVLTLLAVFLKQLLPGATADTVIVEGFLTYLPEGLAGLGVVAFFSVIMSSADTQMFSTASIFLKDIIRTKRRLYFTWTFLGIAVLGFVVAILFQTIVDIAILYSIIFGIIGMFVLSSLVFTFNKRYMQGMYLLLFMGVTGALLVWGLNPLVFFAGFVLIPLSYWLSKAYTILITERRT